MSGFDVIQLVFVVIFFVSLIPAVIIGIAYYAFNIEKIFKEVKLGLFREEESFSLKVNVEVRPNHTIYAIMLNGQHIGEWNDQGNVLFDIVTLNALFKKNLSVEDMKKYLLDNYSK